MVDESETPRVLEELSKSNSAHPRKRVDRQKRTAFKRILIILVLLSPVLLGVVFVAFQQWNLRADLRQLAAENSSLLATINGTGSRIGDLETSLEQLSLVPAPVPTVDNTAIEQLRNNLGAEIENLNAVIAGLQGQIGTRQSVNEGQWQLAEVEYLLRIANQRLLLTGDVAVTLAVLETADGILASAGDARVFAVRQAVGREIAQLRSVETIDREGIYIRLANLKDNVNGISLSNSIQEAYRERLGGQNQPSGIGGDPEQSFLDAGLGFLSSVFIWREWEDSPNVTYPPQEGIQIKHNITLMLEQAQLAVLTRQPDVFAESLARAKIWVEQYLAGMSTDTDGLLGELESLLEVNLAPALPDISQSLALLRQLRANSNGNNAAANDLN